MLGLDGEPHPLPFDNVPLETNLSISSFIETASLTVYFVDEDIHSTPKRLNFHALQNKKADDLRVVNLAAPYVNMFVICEITSTDPNSRTSQISIPRSHPLFDCLVIVL